MVELIKGQLVKILKFEDDDDWTTNEMEQIADEIVGQFGKVVTTPDIGTSWVNIAINGICFDRDDGDEGYLEEIFLKIDWVVVV